MVRVMAKKVVKARRGVRAEAATSRKRAPATSRKTPAIRTQKEQRLDVLEEEQRRLKLRVRQHSLAIEGILKEFKEQERTNREHEGEISNANQLGVQVKNNFRRIELGNAPFNEGTLPWLLKIWQRLDRLEAGRR
jgi:hypothetical protein